VANVHSMSRAEAIEVYLKFEHTVFDKNLTSPLVTAKLIRRLL
jgi:hypothetical protein